MHIRIILAALALTVAACGSQPSKPSRASTEAANKKALLAFAQCMREHGVNMPDPKFESGGGVTMEVTGKNVSREKMDAAQHACEKYQKQVRPPDGAHASDANDKEFRKKALANAQCMRDHGINMPDPTFGANGSVKMRMKVDPNSAKFKQAMQACRSTAPIAGGPGR